MSVKEDKNLVRFEDLMSRVQFHHWKFYIGKDGDRHYLQVQFIGECTSTGALNLQFGRKWPLSPWMTDSEVIQTAFKAVETAVEHETREQFRYRGKAIFGPHFDVDKLHELCQDPNALDVRDER